MDPSIRLLTPTERFAIISAENVAKRAAIKANLDTPAKVQAHLAQQDKKKGNTQ